MPTEMFYQCSYCGITEETTKTAECTKCGDTRKKLTKKQRSKSTINYYFTPEIEEPKAEIETPQDLSDYLSRMYNDYND